MIIKKLTLKTPGYPERLRQIPSPPKQLYHAGAPLGDLLKRPAVAIVGTRKISPYGQQATMEFARDLARQGLVIISGLALGLDALAHKVALENGGLCIAVLPCPLEKIVPVTNRRLAEDILAGGGVLVSEYPAGEWPKPQNFIARNRLMSGLSDVVLIPEAGGKSGALYTANFAVEQGKHVLVVPGDIYAPGSQGVNKLLKQGQAGAATQASDVLSVLGLRQHNIRPDK
ncbi:MAG TPA: DNA-processing protein DprA, partial [Candidatus Saccharimonadales bacterium]|nr:DNA-processing protein DprA [Candidatus Saccharimonadales bacterium]